MLYQSNKFTFSPSQTRELACLVQFEHNNIYLGVSFKKKYKAPTDNVICLKHPKVQNIKSKHIYCLCADDNKTMYHWLTGIRMAKVGLCICVRAFVCVCWSGLW